MRLSDQEALQNGNRIEIEVRFNFRIHLLNIVHIIKQYTCQVLFNNSTSWISLCGVKWWDKSIEKEGWG